MPWVKDENGERKYKVSIYAKEELPTWDEIYNEFWKKKIFHYKKDIAEHQELDLYWKVPRRRYLLGIMCNQFNKTLFEDKMRQKILKVLNNGVINIPNGKIIDIRFLCEFEDFTNVIDIDVQKQNIVANDLFLYYMEMNNVGKIYPPPIYTFTLPSKEKNPFIINKEGVRRVDLTSDSRELMLFPLLLVDVNGNQNLFTPVPPILDTEGVSEHTKSFNAILDIMMQPYKEYFEDGIGWKDEDPKNIRGTSKINNWVPKYDPAL